MVAFGSCFEDRMRYAEELEVGLRQRVKDDFKLFGLSTWNDEVGDREHVKKIKT